MDLTTVLQKGRVCGEYQSEQHIGNVDDDVSSLVNDGDVCIYRIYNSGNNGTDRLRVKLHQFTAWSKCEDSDMVFIMADSKPHGPFCAQNGPRRHRRYSAFDHYTELDAELKGGITVDHETITTNMTDGPIRHVNTYSNFDDLATAVDDAVTSGNYNSTDLEGVFKASEVDVIYVTAPGGYKFRFRFEFDWELVEIPDPSNGTEPFVPYSYKVPKSENDIDHTGTYTYSVDASGIEDFSDIYVKPAAVVDQFGVPTDYTATCQLSHFTVPSLAIFARNIHYAVHADKALDSLENFGKALEGFESNFEKFESYCSSEALEVPCEMFRYGYDTTLQEVVGTLEAVLKSVINNCKHGFGYKWMIQLDQLALHVGGIFPEIIIPNVSTQLSYPKPSGGSTEIPLIGSALCGSCRRDADCGDQSLNLACGNQGKCVCASNWINYNGNNNDGCELNKPETIMNSHQCDKPTGTTHVYGVALCSSCRSDSDCGDWGVFYLRCSQSGKCVCGDQWIDANGNAQDGCEKYNYEYKMNQNQCDNIDDQGKPDQGPPKPGRPGHNDPAIPTVSTTKITTTPKQTTAELSTLAPLPVQLCKTCRFQSDCDTKNTHMVCGNKGRCVCEDFWVDQNKNLFDGCEKLELGFRVNHAQCDTTPVPTRPTTTTQRTTIRPTTTKQTTPTKQTTTTIKSITTIPTTTQVVPLPLQLCQSCQSQSDCGRKATHMICGYKGRCVCEDFWEDQNRNVFDGCEKLELGFRVNHSQCDSVPVPTHKATTTPATTRQTVTIAPTITLDETTKVMNNVQLIEPAPTACPSQWGRRKMEPLIGSLGVSGDDLQEHELCEVKYLKVCTAGQFENLVADHCKKDNLIETYNIIVSEFSRIASAGAGDRHCIFHTNLIACDTMNFFRVKRPELLLKKLRILSDELFVKCGKATLREKLEPHVNELSALLDDKCQKRELSMTTVAPSKTSYTKYPESGLCAARSYGIRAVSIFDARAFDMVDSAAARGLFSRLAKEVGRQGKKFSIAMDMRGTRPACNLAAGRAPCELLEFPRKEFACQLVTRFTALFDYVSQYCNEQWIQRYSPMISSLVQAAAPANDAQCPEMGLEFTTARMRQFNEQYETLFNKTVKETLTEVASQNRIDTETKRDERRRTKQERAQTRNSKRVQNAQHKLERARNSAEVQMEKAKDEFERQKAMFEKVNSTTVLAMNSEINPVMLMDVVPISELVKEYDDEEEYEYYEDYDASDTMRGQENLLSECAFPDQSDHANLLTRAHQKFTKTLKMSLAKVPNRMIKSSFVRRLNDRFEAVLDFFLNVDQTECDSVKIRCYDMAIVFGAAKVKHFHGLVSHATQLVKQIEDKCKVSSFATYFMTLNGKSDRVLPNDL